MQSSPSIGPALIASFLMDLSGVLPLGFSHLVKNFAAEFTDPTISWHVGKLAKYLK